MPCIHFVFFMQFSHVSIPVGLGKHAGSGDGRVYSISFNYAMVRNFFVWLKPVAINQKYFRLIFEFIQSKMHRFERRLKNIDSVYLFIAHACNSKRDSFFLDHRAQPFPLFRS